MTIKTKLLLIVSCITLQSFGQNATQKVFTSDIDKDKKLYLLNAEEIIRIFEIVGNDYPHKIEWKRDDKGNESLTVD